MLLSMNLDAFHPRRAFEPPIEKCLVRDKHMILPESGSDSMLFEIKFCVFVFNLRETKWIASK